MPADVGQTEIFYGYTAGDTTGDKAVPSVGDKVGYVTSMLGFGRFARFYPEPRNAKVSKAILSELWMFHGRTAVHQDFQ